MELASLPFDFHNFADHRETNFNLSQGHGLWLGFLKVGAKTGPFYIKIKHRQDISPLSWWYSNKGPWTSILHRYAFTDIITDKFNIESNCTTIPFFHCKCNGLFNHYTHLCSLSTCFAANTRLITLSHTHASINDMFWFGHAFMGCLILSQTGMKAHLNEWPQVVQLSLFFQKITLSCHPRSSFHQAVI